MELLREWADWHPKSAPYCLEADWEVLGPLKDRWTNMDWEQFKKQPDFGEPGVDRLHLGLLPHPFCGDLLHASIYVLMLNPGQGFVDYFGEYEVESFRNELLKNLRQDFSGTAYPFMFLDPQFSWHGGFSWWNDKLIDVMQALTGHGGTLNQVRAELANHMASIELVPYHSASFSNTGGLTNKLRSAQLARAFVSEYVLPRVKNGQAIVVVARKTKVWNVPGMSGVTNYDKNEAISARLNMKSRGGLAIHDHMLQILAEKP